MFTLMNQVMAQIQPLEALVITFSFPTAIFDSRTTARDNWMLRIELCKADIASLTSSLSTSGMVVCTERDELLPGTYVSITFKFPGTALMKIRR